MQLRPILLPALLITLGQPGGAQEQARLELPPIDFVQVEKAQRRMTLFARGNAVHVIEAIQLGDAPQGQKFAEGDERTPEGQYFIDTRNPQSAFHLSLRLSYPTPLQMAEARAEGRNPGGNIFIHGQPNWLAAGRVPGDWTDGCIAISNDEIEALWEAVPDGTPVLVKP